MSWVPNAFFFSVTQWLTVTVTASLKVSVSRMRQRKCSCRMKSRIYSLVLCNYNFMWSVCAVISWMSDFIFQIKMLWKVIMLFSIMSYIISNISQILGMRISKSKPINPEILFINSVISFHQNSFIRYLKGTYGLWD